MSLSQQAPKWCDVQTDLTCHRSLVTICIFTNYAGDQSSKRLYQSLNIKNSPQKKNIYLDIGVLGCCLAGTRFHAGPDVSQWSMHGEFPLLVTTDRVETGGRSIRKSGRVSFIDVYVRSADKKVRGLV